VNFTCLLCGHTSPDVRYALVKWRGALPGMWWSHVPRCTDRVECRQRVEGNGEDWPVVVDEKRRTA